MLCCEAFYSEEANFLPFLRVEMLDSKIPSIFVGFMLSDFIRPNCMQKSKQILTVDVSVQRPIPLQEAINVETTSIFTCV